VSDNGMQALGGITGLTSLNLCGCVRVLNDGLRALAGLTAPSPTSTCGVVSEYQRTGWWHLLASLPSPPST
jgi:hypothetical protein